MGLQTRNRLDVLLFGDEGVGTTSIVHQYIHEEYPAVLDSTTIENSRDIHIDNEHFQIDLRTLTVPEAIKSHDLADKLVCGAEGFLLVYDISSASSFEAIKRIYQGLRHKRNRRPIFIVGNKCDKDYERQITHEMGRDLARKLHCGFAEVSSKKTGGLDDLFFDLGTQILATKKRNEARQARKPPPSKSKLGLHQTRPTFGSTFDHLWNRILAWFLGYDRRLQFDPIPGLEEFQSPPISSVSSLSLPQKWAVWRNRSSERV